MGELLNASIMFFAPLTLIASVGKMPCCWLALLCLYYYWLIVRHLSAGSGYSENAAMFEVPFLLVGCFKYITSQFECVFQRRFIWSVSASLSNWRDFYVCTGGQYV